MSTSLSRAPTCHVCGEASLDEVAGFPSRQRVTSDCRLWPAGGRLHVCRTCGGVQKLTDATWAAEVAQIYQQYDPYYQADGAEQAVFSNSGHPSARSSRLLDALRREVALPPRGRLLDIGCGNGATLRAFARALPDWSLVGTELSERHRREVEALPGVERLYTCSPAAVPGAFDLITMIHVLEHVPAPQEYLANLRAKLTPGGRLFIEVPDHSANPFDLLIADHCAHFTAATAAILLGHAGYDVAAAQDWVPKELSLVAHAAVAPKSPSPAANANRLEYVSADVRWLAEVVAAARQVATAPPFGVFGTSIAATWLCGELADRVAFFVDEDPQRVGRIFLDRPVLHPHQVPAHGHVFLSLPPPLAAQIHRRLGASNGTYHLPPHRRSGFPA